jgi:hypothetical protein
MASEEGASNPNAPNLLTFDRSSIPRLFTIVDRLERALGLPHGFYEHLVDTDDDWSFVIKIHALMESSMTMLLTERIGGRSLPDSPELADALSHLEMSRTHVGKVELAFTLGLIKTRDRRLLRFLSELRNTFVHHIKNVSPTPQDHIASCDGNQRRSFVHALFHEPTDHLTAVSLANPRRSIWFISLMLLQHLRVQFEALQVSRSAPGTSRAEFIREMQELRQDMEGVMQRIKGETASSEGQSKP